MFTVPNFCANTDGVVELCEWVYTNDEGSVSGKLRLPFDGQGPDFIPLGLLRSGTLVRWVEEHIQNSTEEFDAHIAAANARAVAETAAVWHKSNGDDTYSEMV